jgi:hypothetical protein
MVAVGTDMGILSFELYSLQMVEQARLGVGRKGVKMKRLPMSHVYSRASWEVLVLF